MKTPYPYTRYDTFNHAVIQRHKTAEAAVRSVRKANDELIQQGYRPIYAVAGSDGGDLTTEQEIAVWHATYGEWPDQR